jgi:hypothetical protein
MNNKFSTERIPIILYFLNLKPQNGNFNFLLNITVKIILKKHNESIATRNLLLTTRCRFTLSKLIKLVKENKLPTESVKQLKISVYY